ncbi:MAG: exopolysaccharide biosynthesis polyprenyl glycosylphosphotransferase, partial [Burkholderiaceae bacterium]|nr:exopolysaccharide biosynthesis polyprenyl glycosylphosphotransferase [Burkholderiaceae bacterium]
MFEDRSYKRTFLSAPQSVASLVAAFLEPSLMVGTFLIANGWVGQAITRPELTLSLLVFALTFPGRNRFRENFFDASVDIVINWLTLLGLLMFCGTVTRSFGYFDEQALIIWAAATTPVQICAVWLGKKWLQRQALQPASRRTAIVIGGGALGVKVARALDGIDDHGSDFLGYFDDRADSRLHQTAALNHLGGLNDVAAFVGQKAVREVFITLPLGSQPRIVDLLERLQGTTASIFFVPDVFGISIIQGRLQDMNGVPVVGICETPFTGTNELVKRISDVVLSSIILIVVSPLLLALAIGVKLSSPGPVIFKQRRNGLEGEEIIVYKFRSMTTQDNGSVVRQATRNDPRLTAFGAFMRRTSLDELPQFINVLQGRMSIVGPRPHAVAHNEEYRNLITAYMVRHKVRPGVT